MLTRVGYSLLQESLSMAHRSGAIQTNDLERVVVDTTVQEKAITHPPGWKSRRNYCQSRQPYLSAACPASDTTLSCEPVAPLTPMAPITLPSTTRGLPPRDAITSSSVAR